MHHFSEPSRWASACVSLVSGPSPVIQAGPPATLSHDLIRRRGMRRTSPSRALPGSCHPSHTCLDPVSGGQVGLEPRLLPAIHHATAGAPPGQQGGQQAPRPHLALDPNPPGSAGSSWVKVDYHPIYRKGNWGLYGKGVPLPDLTQNPAGRLSSFILHCTQPQHPSASPGAPDTLAPPSAEP